DETRSSSIPRRSRLAPAQPSNPLTLTDLPVSRLPNKGSSKTNHSSTIPSKRKANEISAEEDTESVLTATEQPHVYQDHSDLAVNDKNDGTHAPTRNSTESGEIPVVPHKKAYQLYTTSLNTIKHKTTVDARVRDYAGDILKTRESSFRTDYFYIENLLQKDAAEARKLSLVEDGEEEPSHLVLPFDLVSSELGDEDFQLGEKDSETNTTATHDEELTGEIPEPIEIDRLVGPGEFSSQLSTEGCLVISGCDISTTVMRHRRALLMEPTLTDVEDLLLTNFVVSRLLLLRLLPVEKVDEAFPSHDPIGLQPAELDLVGRLTTYATTYSYDQLRQWFDQQPRLTTSIVHRAISSYFWEAGLWSDCNWYKKGTGDNEDTFTNCLIKPLLAGTFGDFAGCSFRWSRDSLRSGRSEDPDARLQLPDYQVSIGTHSIVLGEFKTAMASLKSMQDDYVKLVFMGKKALDGLYKSGYHTPVILIHGRGMSVDIYRLSLRSEAIYHLHSLGTFRLISGPLELPLLLGLGPLVSAR
ncbi:hypothetical protein BGZ49_004535, partial [Haplosporangium sp. Z 27]